MPQGYKSRRFYKERYATEHHHYVVMLMGALQPSSSTQEPAKLRVTKRNKNEVETVIRPFSSNLPHAKRGPSSLQREQPSMKFDISSFCHQAGMISELKDMENDDLL